MLSRTTILFAIALCFIIVVSTKADTKGDDDTGSQHNNITNQVDRVKDELKLSSKNDPGLMKIRAELDAKVNEIIKKQDAGNGEFLDGPEPTDPEREKRLKEAEAKARAANATQTANVTQTANETQDISKEKDSANRTQELREILDLIAEIKKKHGGEGPTVPEDPSRIIDPADPRYKFQAEIDAKVDEIIKKSEPKNEKWPMSTNEALKTKRQHIPISDWWQIKRHIKLPKN